MKFWYGKVEDIDDPEKLYRARIRVYGFYDDVKELPWARPLNGVHGNREVPPVDSEVFVFFEDGDYHKPIWVSINNLPGIEDLDYLTSTIVTFRNLKDFGAEGFASISIDKSRGIDLRIDNSFVSVEYDKNVILTNSKKIIHIKDDIISLGSKDKSAEPGVLGDKNADSLNEINEAIKELMKTISDGLDTLRTAAAANPYTVGLVPPLIALKTQILITSTKLHGQIKGNIPKTKSKVVTLD